MPLPPPPFVAHCQELLSPLGTVRVRRMFGGHGFYADELFIALAFGQRFYLKADDATRDAFAAAGCVPFTYDAAGGERTVTSYWTAPDEALESADAMVPWARLALAAALRSRAPKRTRQPGPKPKAASRKRASAPAAAAGAEAPAVSRPRRPR